MRLFFVAVFAALVALAAAQSESKTVTAVATPDIKAQPCCESVRQTLIEIRKDIRLWLLDRLFGKLLLLHDGELLGNPNYVNCVNGKKILELSDESSAKETSSNCKGICGQSSSTSTTTSSDEGQARTSSDPTVEVTQGTNSAGNSSQSSSTTTSTTSSDDGQTTVSSSPAVEVTEGSSSNDDGSSGQSLTTSTTTSTTLNLKYM